ncbi:MAG: glycoside hydrolase [Chloroflexi bacterium]|nr:glycoside hydrolase [Chloroflexota bacterium]
MNKTLLVEHGIVCRLPGARLGYFGWPAVARLDDGTLAVASSGLRSEHICPWGKTVLNVSRDDGRTWSPPRVINDSPIDDRDAGIVHLGGGRLLVSWFTADTRQYVHADWVHRWLGEQELADWQVTLSTWTDEIVQQWLGSWIMLSEDRGATWGAPIRVPVSAPAGPAVLADGDLLYLGKDSTAMSAGRIRAARSRDGGHTWEIKGEVPLYPGTSAENYHEPHVVELPDGRLVGMIRIESSADSDVTAAGLVHFSLAQTESSDGGHTWSVPRPLGFHGSPPHLLRHSSGMLVCVYGYRQPGYGQRAMLSRDDGATWEHDWIIRDDGPDGDLGYPTSVELGDGGIFTVYYQKAPGDAKCSLLWSRWTLP